MAKAKVAILKTKPETVINDYGKLLDLAEFNKFLSKDSTTILKDNISWHFPFPGANTTPWQLEGAIRALKAGGFDDLVAVQNDTVVTDAFKGERLNRYTSVFERYRLPVLYNFRGSDIAWTDYRPKGKML